MREEEGRTEPQSRQAAAHGGAAELSGGGSFEQWIEHVPAAFAVTEGAEHTLLYANAAFRRLTAAIGYPEAGAPIAEAFPAPQARDLIAVLDGVVRTGVVARDRSIASVDGSGASWRLTAWPDVNPNGITEHVVIEFRATSEADMTLDLQRGVAERMLISALREGDAAESAEASRRRAIFLADAGRRLSESLEEEATRAAVSGLSLPSIAAWCIVDLLDGDGSMRRLAIVHPNATQQARLRELEGRWSPGPHDSFGLAAALRTMEPTLIAHHTARSLAAGADDPQVLATLREAGVGPLLTVPLITRDRIVGAITFVGHRDGDAYTADDVALAEDLAGRAAMALDSARLHGEALSLRRAAESASKAKSAFLATMSHELRTPLNAIGGYADLIDMGLRGPVTAAQHADIARIRSNQRHLMVLITDILNFTHVASGRVVYTIENVVARQALGAAVALIEPLILQKQLVCNDVACDDRHVARADPEKLSQILVNLLANAIKFTPPGGRLTIGCAAEAQSVLMHVQDTGVGIPAEKLTAIFDPFVQVRSGLAGRDGGVGLGLAVSRDLARAMGGDLTVDSEPGVGSTFTLRLPAAEPGDAAEQPTLF